MLRAAVAIVLLLSGCASAQPSAAQPAKETPKSTPIGSAGEAIRALGPPGEALRPGRYTRAGFAPRITFEVADGWTAQQVGAGFFDIQQDPGSLDVIAVQFGNVVGPSTAAEAVAQVRGRDQLEVTGSEEVIVDGVEGSRITIETSDPATTQPPTFRQVLTLRAGPISIASARRLQVTLLDTSEGVLAIMVGGSIEKWDRTLELAAPVVESVTVAE